MTSGVHYTSFSLNVQKGRNKQDRTEQERLAGDEHSSLQGPFISNEENEVLWLRQLYFSTNIRSG
jgi:hypothetical protein